MWVKWVILLTSRYNRRQADTCIQSPGSQRWLQTSCEDVTIHNSEQHAAEHHGGQLCVRQHRQFNPRLRQQLPAAQSGGKPHRAIQHHKWIHCGHHKWPSIIRKHIAGGQVSQQALTDVLPSSLTAYCVLTESCGNTIHDDSVVTAILHQLSHR